MLLALTSKVQKSHTLAGHQTCLDFAENYKLPIRYQAFLAFVKKFQASQRNHKVLCVQYHRT